jgi:two-component system chemotaxis response regulator CheB
MAMSNVRVLVVEDSLSVRKHLVEVLESDPELEVVGEAEDGRSAIELCEARRPDVVTLDMMLPVMSGLAATEYIMAYCPTPVLIISASTNRGEALRTYDALAAGAVDVIEKPTGEEPPGDWERRVIAAVKLVSRIKVITHPRGKLGRRRSAPSGAPPLAAPPSSGSYRLVALGASTGGPGAVLELLRGLPSDFPLPILFVIHLSRPFAESFADWLDGQSPFRVSFARDGETLPEPGRGTVFLAPADYHLVVRNGKLRLTTEPERHSCRPSVDVLFESIAEEVANESIACLLTGMGKDGAEAEGLLAIRRAGGATIAQDEASSVIYGMPREAVLLGAAEQVVPLDQLAAVLTKLAGRQRAGRRS